MDAKAGERREEEYTDIALDHRTPDFALCTHTLPPEGVLFARGWRLVRRFAICITAPVKFDRSQRTRK